MDYEKAYKAVLETATQWIKDGCTDKERICLESVFPELRESEDERIRRIMINYFKNKPEQYTFGGLTNIEVVDFLERQKEQGHPCDSAQFEEGFKAGLELGLRKKKEPKQESGEKGVKGPQEIGDWRGDEGVCEKQKKPHYTKRNALFDKCLANCDPEIRKKVSDEIDSRLKKEQKPSEEQPQVADASKMEQEVDLEKEIDKGIADYSFTKTIDLGGFKTTVLDYAKIARHFYELGLNARKEEKK